MAVERVRNRVIEGGHHVPEDVIRRRFDAGWRNFQQIYRDIVNEWRLYDTTETYPRLVVEGEHNEQAGKQRTDSYKGRKRSVLGRRRCGDATGRERGAKRAIETTGSVPTWRDGKIVYDTEV